MRLRILEICTVRNWFIPQVGFLMRKLEIYDSVYLHLWMKVVPVCFFMLSTKMMEWLRVPSMQFHGHFPSSKAWSSFGYFY